MTFVHPYSLLLLALLVPVGYAFARGRRVATLLRVACLAGVILAIARPVLFRPATPIDVVLAEVGPQAGDDAAVAVMLQRARSTARAARLILFSNRAETIDDPTLLADPRALGALRARLNRPLFGDDPPEGGAATAAALQLAGALVPRGEGSTITLLTTGLTTRGDAAAEAYHLAARGIAVRCVQASVDPTGGAPDAVVRSVEAPAAARVGQTVPVDVTIESTTAGVRRLRVEAGGVERVVAATLGGTGTNRIRVDVPMDRVGIASVRVTLDGARPDARYAGRSLSPALAAVDVGAASRVLVVQPDAASTTAAALRSILADGADVSSTPPAEMTLSAIARADVIVIADVPAAELDSATTRAIDAAVAGGAGLVVTGASNSFGPGGYADSPLAALLPVGIAQQRQTTDPTIAVVFAIDTSASMRGDKLDVAKEIARLVIGHLRPHDRVGIVEFFGNRRWAAPLQPLGDGRDIARSLGRLTAGGGTLLYPAVEEAAFALRNVSASAKHVLLLSDGIVEDAPFEALARRMADDGINVSTIACVAGRAAGDLLPDIAEWGHGRFYDVPDRYVLPDISLKQPQPTPLPSIVTTPTPVVVGDDALARGIDLGASPIVDGYVKTTAKQTADVLLRTADGHPLLARWRHGAGQVAAMPTQLGSTMTASLARQPAFATLLRAMIGELASGRGDRLSVRPLVRPGGLEVDVIATADADAGTRTLGITVRGEDGRVARALTVEPTSAGRWNALVRGLPSGIYRIEAYAVGSDASGAAAASIPTPRAMGGLTTDVAAIRRIEDAAAAAATAAARAGATDDPAVARAVELRGPLIVSAVLLLVAHVAARRWPARRPAGDAMSAASAAVIAALLLSPSPASAASPVVDAATRPAPTSRLSSLEAACEAFEKGKPADGLRLLDGAATNGSPGAIGAAITAGLYAQPAAAERYFDAARVAEAAQAAPDRATMLYAWMGEGSAAWDAGHVDRAAACWAEAAPWADSADDQQFIAERLVASARRAGTLPALATRWARDPTLPAGRAILVATSLREVGAVTELLDWWRHCAADPRLREAALSRRVADEVTGAALDAGRADDAEAIARALLAAGPDDDRGRQLEATARLLLTLGKPAEVDALLARRLVASADRAEPLRMLAAIAERLGRTQIERNASEALIRLGGEATRDGLLRLSSAAWRSGDRDDAAAYARRAAATPPFTPADALRLSNAFEAIGLWDDAIALLRGAANQEESLRHHVAWLLRRTNRAAEAADVLEAILRDGTAAAARERIGDELVDLAAQAHALPALIDSRRVRLRAGNGDAGDVTVLVAALARAGDVEAAATAIDEYASVLGGADEQLDRLVALYLRASRLDDADRVLKAKLAAAASPDEAMATLERLALLAQDRHRPADVEWAVAQVRARGGAGVDELLGTLFARLARYAEAADRYRAAIDARPASAGDLWLSWASAMTKAGRRAETVDVFARLADGAASDDAFALAVDGLLNAAAPPETLRVARHLGVARLARSPRSVLLYHVLADLSDELGDAGFSQRLGEACALAFADQRPQQFRLLVDLARAAGRTDVALARARTIVALGYEYPPDLFLDLGKAELAAGDLREAMRCFERAAEGSSADAVAPRVGKLLEQAGYVPEATAVTASLADRRPYDVDVTAELARLRELNGEPRRAFDGYLRVVRLRLARMPDGDVDPSATNAIARLVLGAVATARDGDTRSRLTELLAADVARRLTSTIHASKPPPSLAAVAEITREAFLMMGTADEADAMDDHLLAAWPDDAALRAAAAKAREDQGLWGRAVRFVNSPAAMPRAPAIQAALAARQPTTTPADVEAAADLLPQLISRGRRDEARALLARIDSGRPTRPTATFPVLLAASRALNDTPAVTRWATRWLEETLSAPPTTTVAATADGDAARVAKVARALSAAWPVVDDAGRAQLLERLAAVATRTGVPAAARPSTAAMITLRAASGTDLLDARRDALVSQVLSDVSSLGAAAPALLGTVPWAERPTLIARTLAAMPAETRLSYLLRLGARYDFSADAPTAAAVVAALNDLPQGQQAFEPPPMWASGPQHPSVLRSLSEAATRMLAAARPDAAAPTVTAAIRAEAARAMARVGEPAQADALALAAIDDLAHAAAHPASSGILRSAIASLSESVRARLAASATSRVTASDLANPWRAIVSAAALDSLGRQRDALDLLRHAYDEHRDATTLREALMQHLSADGRHAEAIDVFLPRLDDAPDGDPRLETFVADELTALFRASEVRPRQRGVGRATATPPDFGRSLSLGDPRRLAQDLRVVLEANRATPRAMSLLIGAPDAGGLVACGRPPARVSVANWPGALDEMRGALAASPPWGIQVPLLIGLMTGRDVQPSSLEPLIAELTRHAASRSLTTNDRLLLVAIARRADVRLPITLVDELWSSALADDSPVAFQELAEALEAQGAPCAADARRWADACVAAGQLDARLPDPSSPSRPAYLSRPARAPLPVLADVVDPASTATRWRAMLDAGDNASATAELAALRDAGRCPQNDGTLGLIAARLAAERGDVARFRSELAAALESAHGVAVVDGRTVSSLALDIALPRRDEQGAIEGAGRWLATMLDVIDEDGHRRPADADVCRELCLLGSIALDRSEVVVARRTLDLAAASMRRCGEGDHELWVADLAWRSGASGFAGEITDRLLAEHRLPAARIVPYLKTLSPALACPRAIDATAYCGDPRLGALATPTPAAASGAHR